MRSSDDREEGTLLSQCRNPGRGLVGRGRVRPGVRRAPWGPAAVEGEAQGPGTGQGAIGTSPGSLRVKGRGCGVEEGRLGQRVPVKQRQGFMRVQQGWALCGVREVRVDLSFWWVSGEQAGPWSSVGAGRDAPAGGKVMRSKHAFWV